MGWGGRRPRKPWTEAQKAAARAKRSAEQTVLSDRADAAQTVPAEPRKPALDMRRMAAALPDILAMSKEFGRKGQTERTRENSPFRIPKHPAMATPASSMANDSALCESLDWSTQEWVAGTILEGIGAEGLAFLGYPYLAQLAQRPEYRIFSETIAEDSTRRWIEFKVSGDENEKASRKKKDPIGEAEREQDPDENKKAIKRAGKTDKVKALKDDQDRLGVQHAFYSLCRDDGFFGRSHLYMNFGTELDSNPDELRTPIGDGNDALSRGKIEKGTLKELKVIEATWAYPQAYNATNPLKAGWYDPKQWYVMGAQIDGSRFLTMIGHPVPDLLKPAYSFGGLSLSQMAKPYVDIWLTTRQSVANLIHSFSIMVLSTDLETILQPGNAGALMMRAAMFNALRDNQGLMVINKDSEEFQNVSAQLSGLHELQSQAQEHMASVARIPLVKFTGISPAGLNASSEGEIAVYDDSINGNQLRTIQPHLAKVINFQQLSLWGEIDPEITFDFVPLRVMTEKEKAELQKSDAERDKIYVDMGAIAPEEVRQSIVADEELPYTALDPDEMPEPPDQEGMVGPGIKPPAEGAEGDGAEGGGANDADLPFGTAADAKFNEGDHPRAPDGKFGSGGGRSSGSKSAKAISSADTSWNDYGTGGLIKQASSGEPVKAGDIDLNGHVLSETDARAINEHAASLQAAAESETIKGGKFGVWRGMALPKGSDIKAMFKHNSVVNFPSLTAVSVDRSVAEKYMDPQFIGEDEGERVLINIQRKGDVIGHTSTDADFNEALMPAGAKYRVVGFKKSQDGTYLVTLYDPGTLNSIKKE